MSEAIEKADAGPRWKTYLVAFLFVAPAAVSWLFARTYIVPRLMLVWREAGATSGQEAGILNATQVLFGNPMIPVAVCAIALILLEWRGRAWVRARIAVLGVLAWVINLVVLFAMSWLTISWATIAPMVRHP